MVREGNTAGKATPGRPATKQAGPSLAQYTGILLKRKALVLGVLAIVMAATVLFTYQQTRIYEAKLTVIVDASAPQVLGRDVREVVDLGSGSYWMSRDYLASQKNILTSHELALKVVDRLRLHEDRDFWKPESRRNRTREQAATRLQSSVRVAALQDNRVVELYLRHPDPATAARVCNAMADEYLEFNLEHKLGSTKDAIKWLSEQLDGLKKQLNEAELALHQFKKRNNVLSVPLEDKQNLLTQRIQRLAEQLTTMELKHTELGARQREISSLHNEDPLQDAVGPMVEGALLSDIKKVYIEEQRKLLELKGRYLANHPLVVAQQSKVDAALGHLRREIDNVLAATAARTRETGESERQFRAKLEGAKAEALDLNLKQIEYARLKRTLDNTEKLYGLVLSRLKESDLTANLRVNNIRVLDRARLPGAPVHPRVQINLLVALLLGLFGGIGLAFLVETLDSTIKSQEELEALSGLPFLGILPSIAEGNGVGSLRRRGNGNGAVDPTKDLYLHTHPKSSFAECARSVRTNLLFMSPEKPLSTVLVTSPGPREGKTTTAISLAIAMAQGDQRVLLVDTDLRRPRIHRAFGVTGEVGITSLFMGSRKIEDVVKSTDVPNLWVLPCGPLPPNPAELLNTGRFDALLESMRERFDRIVFDSPPVIAVTDAAVLGSRLDGVLIVAKAGQTARDGVRRSVRILTDVGAHLLGCVLNDIDLANRYYGQYYYYYHRYGYESSPREVEVPAPEKT